MPDFIIHLILAALLWVVFGAVYGAIVVLQLIEERRTAPMQLIFWMYVVAGWPSFIGVLATKLFLLVVRR